jgi:hypothetical protein
MPSIDSVTFDTAGLRFTSEEEGLRVWHTEAGDGLGLSFFARPPDIGADLGSLEALRAYYRDTAAAAGAAILEIDVVVLDGCSAVRSIVKVPQQPTGTTYVGAFTLPFRDFSFVVQVQCEERGTTGVREAVVVRQALRDGRVSFAPGATVPQGWMCEPYDPTLSDGYRRNLSEDVEYDGQFADHPLSRLRQTLSRLERSLQIAEEVRSQPPFRFEQIASPRRPWWRFW